MGDQLEGVRGGVGGEKSGGVDAPKAPDPDKRGRAAGGGDDGGFLKAVEDAFAGVKSAPEAPDDDAGKEKDGPEPPVERKAAEEPKGDAAGEEIKALKRELEELRRAMSAKESGKPKPEADERRAKASEDEEGLGKAVQEARAALVKSVEDNDAKAFLEALDRHDGAHGKALEAGIMRRIGDVIEARVTEVLKSLDERMAPLGPIIERQYEEAESRFAKDTLSRAFPGEGVSDSDLREITKSAREIFREKAGDRKLSEPEALALSETAVLLARLRHSQPADGGKKKQTPPPASEGGTPPTQERGKDGRFTPGGPVTASGRGMRRGPDGLIRF